METATSNKAAGLRYLVFAAAFVIVIAGMRAAKSLLVPFLLAVFFAVIFTPPLRWLQKKGVPTALALLIVVAVLALAGASVVLLVGRSVNDFSKNLNKYQTELVSWSDRIQTQLTRWGVALPQIDGRPSSSTQNADWQPLEQGLPGNSGDVDDSQDFFADSQTTEAVDSQLADQQADAVPFIDPKFAMTVVKLLLLELGGILSNAVVILVTVVFMLLEASRFPAKLHAALGGSEANLAHVETIVTNIRRYLAIKSATSLLTGVLVTVFLTVLKIEYPVLWGLFAFLLNFVPSIGSILAAVPPVLLALVSAQSGVGEEALGAAEPLLSPGMRALVTALGFVVINCFISYGIEPRFMGQGLGLSALVVFLSLVFWGWVLGPTGMLLSAPLTMSVKIVLENYEDTHWVAVLIGSKAR